MQKVGSEPLKEVSRYESEHTCEEIISTNYITILNTMDIYIYVLILLEHSEIYISESTHYKVFTDFEGVM